VGSVTCVYVCPHCVATGITCPSAFVVHAQVTARSAAPSSAAATAADASRSRHASAAEAQELETLLNMLDSTGVRRSRVRLASASLQKWVGP
jgi:hypothetical protein